MRFNCCVLCMYEVDIVICPDVSVVSACILLNQVVIKFSTLFFMKNCIRLYVFLFLFRTISDIELNSRTERLTFCSHIITKNTIT